MVMKNWYVKDLSSLTGVSVQTLHHYDRIGLLKPSERLRNGYRLYTQEDLLKLQQIIALKSFGFELVEINNLLVGEVNALQHFSHQIKILEQKEKQLRDAKKTLKSIVLESKNSGFISWENLIKIIKEYQMVERLEQNWVRGIFTADELKDYASFQAELDNPLISEKREAFEKDWTKLVNDIHSSLHEEPASSVGITLAGECMAIINAFYGTKYAYLRTKMFEQGFGEGKGLKEVGLTPEAVSWLEKAMDAYWKDRLYTILDQVGTHPSSDILALWTQVLEEMYGVDDIRKQSIYKLALADERVSQEAKKWLKEVSKG